MKHPKFSLVKIFHLILIIIFLGLSSNSFAQKSYNFSFAKSLLDIKDIKADDGNEYQQIRINGFESKGRTGNPNLPVKQLRLLISPYEDVESISVNIKKSEIINLSKKLYPAQYFISPKEKFIQPNKDIYESDKPWPNELACLTKDGFFAGSYHIVNVEITPIIYFPKANQLEFIMELEVILKMKSSTRKPLLGIDKEFYENDLKYLVDNVEDIPVYSNTITILHKNSVVQKVTTLPAYEYVIITRNNLAQYFQKFMNWKKRKGLDIGLVAIEDIMSNYPNGDLTSGIADSAGSIRQYLTDSYPTTKWALLGGNSSVVPVRYGAGDFDLYTIPYNPPTSNDAKIPTDLYFAELDSDWDYDNDQYIGEPPTDQYFSGDITDYYPEIYVGRLLCSRLDQTGAQDILNWTEKIIKYEQNPGNGSTSYLTRVLMHQSDEIQNAHWLNLTKNNLPQTLQSSIDSLSESPSASDPDPSSPTGSQIINQLNNTKYGLWYWFNHGTPVGVAVATYGVNSGGKYGITPLDSYPFGTESGNGFDNLTNQDYPTIVYSVACEVTPFDDWDPHGWWSGYRNLGEGFTVMTNKGGPAFLGYTRYGLGSAGNLASGFASLLSNIDNTNLGKTEMLSRANHYDHYSILSHNLVGCPEARIWTATPSTYNNVSVTDNGSSLTVNSGVSGSTISVCSIDDGATYFSVASNTTSYTFSTSVRPLYITITKPNYLPFIGISGGTITSNTTFYELLKLTGDLTVNSGITLTIDSEATVELNGYSIILNSGTVTVQNGAIINGLVAYLKQSTTLKGYCGSIQSGLNNASSGQTVEIFSGTYSENITNDNYNVAIVGAGINSTTINGTVTFSGADISSLRDLAVNGLISVNSSSGVTIDNVKANNSNCYIDANGSSVNVGDFVSEVSQTRGIYAHNNSSCYVDDSSFRNKYDGQHYEDTSYGDNFAVTFCQNQTYDIVAFNYAYVDNYWCSFSSATEGSTVYGNVNWYSWDYCGMGKISANMSKTLLSKTDDDDPGFEDYKNAMSFFKTVRDKIRNDRREGKENAVQNHSIELKEVVSNLKNFIGKHNDSRYSPSVLGQVATIYGMLEEEGELLTYMTGIAENKSFENLRPFALSCIVTLYVKKGETQRGLDLSDQLLNEYPDHLLAVEWLYGKGIVYKYLMNDPSRAEGIFKEVITRYSDHGTAISAKEQLGIGEKYIPQEQIALAALPAELAINNYPNPFNPETIIQVSLPEAGKFTLKVYNMLGEEVAMLINGELNAGIHEVNFDASKLASGVYIYKLIGNNVNLSKKMILMK